MYLLLNEACFPHMKLLPGKSAFRLFFSVVIGCAIPFFPKAQDMTLRSTTAIDTLNVNTMYRFKDFTKGLLNYKDGKSAASRFNINMLIDEIQFINPAGDTLSVTDENTIDNVMIGDQLFYLKKGAIEVVGNYKPVQLGVSQKMTTRAKDRIGAYGESSGTTAITSTGSLYANDKAFTLKPNENILLAKTVEFYFIRGDQNIILPATRSNLFKLLRERDAKALSTYLSDNKINFRKEEDLRKLLLFCDELKKSEP